MDLVTYIIGVVFSAGMLYEDWAHKPVDWFRAGPVALLAGIGYLLGWKIGKKISRALRPDLFIGTTEGYIKASFFWKIGLPLIIALITGGIFRALAVKIFVSVFGVSLPLLVRNSLF